MILTQGSVHAKSESPNPSVRAQGCSVKLSIICYGPIASYRTWVPQRLYGGVDVGFI